MIVLKFLKFLEALELGSGRASGLLSASNGLVCPPKCLRKASIYRSFGVGKRHEQSLIGDTCHSLIGLLMSSLTRAGLIVSSLTRARLLMSSLAQADA
nr:hypothetical protein CFP56_21389 [Quercus suber]